MSSRLREIGIGAIVVFAAGFVLWPPDELFWQWWTVLPEAAQTESLVLVLLTVLAGAVGIAATALSGIRPSNLAIGGLVAYAVGMALISLSMSPESPVHLLLYGFILVVVLLGAGGWSRIRTADETDSADATDTT